MATKPREAITRHPSGQGFGYPIHRITEREDRRSENDVPFTDLTAACGFTDTIAGTFAPRLPRSARTGELCEKGCWD